MKTKLIPTQNSLRKTTCRAMIELLNQQLADVFDLGLQAKQAHWNVKGPHFIGLHEFFDKVAEELEEFTDDIAERALLEAQDRLAASQTRTVTALVAVYKALGGGAPIVGVE